jgi:predicted RND superfamily exporter protein
MLLAKLLTRLAVGRPFLVIGAGAVLAIAGVLLASRLALQTDLAELLPEDAPSVVALRKLGDRVGGTGNVAIAVESVDGKPDALRAYIPELVEALRRELGRDLVSIRASRRDVSDYYKKYAAYYVSLDDLIAWQKRAAKAIAKQNPAYVDLGDGSDDPVKDLVHDVRAARDKLKPKNAADPQTELLMTEGGKLAVVFLRPASDSLDLAGSQDMMDKIEGVVASTLPALHGVWVAGYTGSIPTALTEVQAIRDDIVSTALLVMLGVGAIVIAYFRGVRELALMSGAVIVGVAVALGFAELWIGHVNAQTAFLGAIIAGTGINYGIIFLDRYRRARGNTRYTEVALEEACEQTLRATGIAALATAVSFGVLAAGEVESFHQFGWIGGVGILGCWVTTFTVVPACIAVADRRYDGRPPPVRALPGAPRIAAGFRAVAALAARAPRVTVLVVAALAVGGIAVAIDARGNLVETDLRRLGTKSSEQSGIQKLDNRLRGMDDRSATPAVIATDDRAETAQVCDVINARRKTDLAPVVQRCYSLADTMPKDVAARQVEFAKLSRDLDAVDEDDLDDRDRADLAELRRALAESPPTDADLPTELREYFVERNGQVGRLAYVEPHDEHIESNLYLLTDAIRSIHLPSGKVIESSGELVVFADVLRAMRRDARSLTIAAAALVLIVLAAVTRRAGAFLRVGGALVAGVATMIGVAVLLGDKLNFFNFVALPTTFGIGIDYAINIEERIRQRGGGAAIADAVAESGPPVVLASLTSMIGYASLLTADSRALSSFGALAIVGEVCCVVVAVVAVPAAWGLLGRRR